MLLIIFLAPDERRRSRQINTVCVDRKDRKRSERELQHDSFLLTSPGTPMAGMVHRLGGGGAVVVAAAAAVSPPEDRVDRQWRRSEGKAVSSESDLTSLGETC